MTGTQIVHVPYKAGQQAIAEMIAGQVHVLFDNFDAFVKKEAARWADVIKRTGVKVD